jgi:hypothetical protein
LVLISARQYIPMDSFNNSSRHVESAPENENHDFSARRSCQQSSDMIITMDDGTKFMKGVAQKAQDINCGDENSALSSGCSTCTSSRGDSSVGSEDWPIEATHLCYELESNNLPCQNRHGDVLELRSSFVRERDVPRILKALELNTSVATADLCEFSLSKLQPASRLALLASICALPGLHTLFLNHFHFITVDMVNALVDGWRRRGCHQFGDNEDQNKNRRDDEENVNRKRKADDLSSSNSSTAAISCPNAKQSEGIKKSDCQLRSLRIQDCGFADENTANTFWERASASLSDSLSLLEVMHVQTPFLAFSLSTFLRSCGRQPFPKLQHLNLTSDVVNPIMLSWSVLTQGIMECRQSLRSFSLQRVDSVARPFDVVHEYALGHALGRALLAGAVPQEVVEGAPPPPTFSGMLSLLIPVLATFPHLKTFRLKDWHLEPPDTTLLSTALTGSFKALKCLDLNDCYWDDPTILHAAITQKRLHRLHIYATEPAALHIHSLISYLPTNGSLVQVTVGGLSEALEFPVALESIAWYVRLNRDYQRRIMIDPSSSVQKSLQVLWRARDDAPALYHLLRESPNLSALMEECLLQLGLDGDI